MTIYTIIVIFMWLAGFGGATEYLIYAIFLSIPIILYWMREINFTNYMPPQNMKIDYDRMNRDLNNGVSKEEVKRRTVLGAYNIKK